MKSEILFATLGGWVYFWIERPTRRRWVAPKGSLPLRPGYDPGRVVLAHAVGVHGYAPDVTLTGLPRSFAEAANRVATGLSPWPTAAERAETKRRDAERKAAAEEWAAGAARRARIFVEIRAPQPDPCAVLGISPDADVAAIKAAWRRAAKTHHPDLGGNVERFQECKAAYDSMIARVSQ